MEKLKKILEENLEVFRAAKSPEHLGDLLKEKGIELGAETVEMPVAQEGVTALSDDDLDQAAGGVSMLNALFLMGSRYLMYQSDSDAAAGTLAYRGDRPANARTLEQRGIGGQPMPLGDGMPPLEKKKGTLI